MYKAFTSQFWYPCLNAKLVMHKGNIVRGRRIFGMPQGFDERLNLAEIYSQTYRVHNQPHVETSPITRPLLDQLLQLEDVVHIVIHITFDAELVNFGPAAACNYNSLPFI
jgi:hypothetical protein